MLLRETNTVRPDVRPQPAVPNWVPDTRYSALLAVMVFLMFFYMSVPLDILDPNRLLVSKPVTPNLLYRSIKFGLLAVSAALIIARYGLAGLVIRRVNGFFWAFVVLATLSVAWSIAPAATETRLGAISTFTLVALAFTLHGWHAQRFQNVVRAVLSILLFGSLILGIYAPNLALELGTSVSLKGAWHGLFTQKNPFGEAASLGFLFWVHAWLAKEVRLVHFLVGGGVAAACLILSNSSTGISAGLFGTIFLLVTMRSGGWNRRYTRSLIFIFVVAISLYILAALDIIPGLSSVLESFNSLSGRDATFSGRTAIWQVMQEQIKQHPALGVGYGAFWTGRDPSTPSYIMVLKTYGYPNEAHDGYLDIANDLGLVGLAIFLGYFVVFLRQGVALLKTEYSQAILFLTLLFHQLLTNLTESTWLFSSNMCFALMTMAMFSLARTHIEQRLQSTIPQRPRRILRSAGLRPRLARSAPSLRT